MKIRQRVAHAAAVMGAAVAGGGVYGLALYDFTWGWGFGAIAAGGLIFGLAFLAGGRPDGYPPPEPKD
jgi:hypothetical protein